MKYLLILWFALGCQTALAVQGRLQNDDFKTPAQLTGAGLPLSKLLNDTNIYVTGGGINDQLSTAITNGAIGGAGGAGGGEVNLLALAAGNWNAEKTAIGLTNSGGTLTRETGAPLDGVASFKFVATANTNFVEPPLTTVPNAFNGRKCQIHFPFYKSTSSLGGIQQDFTLYIFDASNNTIATLPLNGTSSAGETTSAFLAFDCPVPISTRLKYRLQKTSATGTATIVWDDTFLGTGRNSLQVSQTRFLGSAVYPGASGSVWTTSTVGAPVTPPVNTSALTPTLSGSAIAPTTKLPAIRFASVPTGDLVFNLSSDIRGSPGACVVRVSDGTNVSTVNLNYTNSGASGRSNYTFHILNTTALGDTTYTIQFAPTVTGNCILTNTDSNSPMEISTYLYPTNSAVDGNTYDVTGWRVDAVQGGNNPGLTLVSQATPVGAQSAGLTITANSGSNIIPVQQPCSTGAPTSTSTCASGNPEVGLVYAQPAQNDVLVCAQFGTEFTAANTSSRAYGTFQIAETALFPATTIIQSSKAATSWEYLQNTNQIMGGTYRICNTMSLAPGQHALRLLHTAAVTGSITTHIILADGAMNRNIHWTVIPLNQNFTAPVFSALTTKVDSSSSNWRVESISLAANGCAITSQSGFVTSTTAYATNSGCQLNIPAGKFSATPICTVSPIAVPSQICQIDNNGVTNSPTSIFTQCFNGGGSISALPRNIVCMGPK